MMIAGLLAGCAGEVPIETRIANALPAAMVQAKGETEAVATANADAADDPAIWRNAGNPAASLIVGTDKKAGLHVYGLDGRSRDFAAAGLVNNVALVRASDGRVIVVASDRNDPARAKIALYALDTVAAKLSPIGKVDAGAGEAYGICTYAPPAASSDTLVQVVSVLKGGSIALIEIAKDLSAKTVRTWKVPTQAEGCVVESVSGAVYVGEEDVGIWRFSILGDDTQGRLIARADGKQLVADVEGLAIAFGERRYLVASSQGDNAYTVYSLPDHRYLGRFRIAAGRFGPVEETDGIELKMGDFGPDYPQGLFVAQDGMNEPRAQNFKLVSWADVKAALGLE
nr:phytase [Sphingomonas gilva]